MQTIADRIELMLAERHLTKAELARRAGLRKSTLQSVMDTPNRSPRAQTIEKLAAALGVDHTWLATGKHPRSKDLLALSKEGENRIAQALEDAIKERGVTLGPADKAALIAGFLEKIRR